MWPWNNTSVEVEKPKVAAGPVPKAVVAEPEDEVDQYVAIATKAGCLTPAVRMLELRQFLAKNNIPEYDRLQVHRYILSKTVNRQIYYWKPLRRKDRKSAGFHWWFGYNDDQRCLTSQDVYPHLVPASVLETVIKIDEAFPDAAFFVSEIGNVPDPFLLVTFKGPCATPAPCHRGLLVRAWLQTKVKDENEK